MGKDVFLLTKPAGSNSIQRACTQATTLTTLLPYYTCTTILHFYTLSLLPYYATASDLVKKQ
jgi:hypothetical protein